MRAVPIRTLDVGLGLQQGIDKLRPSVGRRHHQHRIALAIGDQVGIHACRQKQLCRRGIALPHPLDEGLFRIVHGEIAQLRARLLRGGTAETGDERW